MPFDRLSKFKTTGTTAGAGSRSGLSKQNDPTVQQAVPNATPSGSNFAAQPRKSSGLYGAGITQNISPVPSQRPLNGFGATTTNVAGRNEATAERPTQLIEGQAYNRTANKDLEPNLSVPNFEKGPAVGGTGFVNLGHLLTINRKSGLQNAQALAAKRAKEAADAQAKLQGYQNQFENKVGSNEVFYDKSKADAAGQGIGDGTPQDTRQYGDVNFLQSQADKAQNGYRGPSAIGELEGYSDFEKGARGTADRVENLGKGNEGIAAEIAKDTGLSGAQSAMSAFYSGASNDDLVSTSKKYAGLGKLLDKANSDSRARASLARERTDAAKDLYSSGVASLLAKQAAEDQARRAKEVQDRAEAERIDRESSPYGGPAETEAGDQSDNRNGEEDLNYVNNEAWAARHGNTYDEWVALGRPSTSDEYAAALAAHPEYKR